MFTLRAQRINHSSWGRKGRQCLSQVWLGAGDSPHARACNNWGVRGDAQVSGVNVRGSGGSPRSDQVLGGEAGLGPCSHPLPSLTLVVSARRGASGTALLAAAPHSGHSARVSLSTPPVPASSPVTARGLSTLARQAAQGAVSALRALCGWYVGEGAAWGPALLPWLSETVARAWCPIQQGGPLSPASAQDERCVPPELCPCRHGGQWYPPNATIQEDCNVWYARPCDL